jgi:hypothetical protein
MQKNRGYDGAVRLAFLFVRFILEELSPEPAEIGHIMRCLNRIARHSYESACAIANSPGLLKSVRKFRKCFINYKNFITL